MPILIHVKMRLSHLFRELHDWILQYMCNSNNETHFLSATVIEKKTTGCMSIIDTLVVDL